MGFSKLFLGQSGGCGIPNRNRYRLIVMAHSDIKDGSISETENGLNNHELRDDVPDQTRGVIRAKFLACILRLADELDITVERLGNGDMESKLINFRDKKLLLERQMQANNGLQQRQEFEIELKKIGGYIESLEYWKKLHLFSTIQKKNMGNDEVSLVINDDYIKRCAEGGDTYERLADDIFSVYQKINKELKEGMFDKIERSKNKKALKTLISVDKFSLTSNQ